MKRKINLSILVICVCFNLFSQNIEPLKYEIKKSLKNLETDYKNDLKRDGKDLNFNPKMLNILLADEVGAFFSDASSLSLQTFSANLNVEEKLFNFGYNFDFRGGDKTKDLSSIGYVGFTIDSKDKIATIYKDGDFVNNSLKLNLKVTKFLGGSIFFPGDDKYETLIKKNRDKILSSTTTKINKFNSDEFDEKIDLITKTYKYKSNREGTIEQEITEYGNSKYVELYTEVAQSEIKYIKENDLYLSISKHWITFDINIPIFKKEYLITDALTNPTPETVNYRPYNAKFSYTYFRKYVKHFSYFLSPQIEIFRNNSIIANNLTANVFSDITPTTNGDFAVVENTEIIVTDDFKKFTTPAFRLEGLAYLYRHTFGLSAALEKNFGVNYNPLNWKLGIPFSLKDKDGKPTVNLELHWKEVNSQHIIGLKANYAFGKYIN